MQQAEIELCGRTYTVRPLTLGQMRRYETQIESLNATPGTVPFAAIVGLIPLLAEALESSPQEVETLVDVVTFPRLWALLMGASGMSRGESQPVSAAQ
ncbi:MAG: hypothetical protein KGL39_31835 [Patescibacteria group bacterium]|nr:hypothetical protein [Patescibacteria group bacterium]